MTDPNPFWRDRSSCAPLVLSAETDWWYGSTKDDVAKAKKVCASCPIQQRCLDDATERKEKHGVWGGVEFTDDRRVTVKKKPGRKPGVDLDEFMHLVNGGTNPVAAANRLKVTIYAVARRAERVGRSDITSLVRGERHRMERLTNEARQVAAEFNDTPDLQSARRAQIGA